MTNPSRGGALRRLDRALFAGLLGLAGSVWPETAQSPSLLFHDVRLFDGDRIIASTDILVAGGKIVRIGPLSPPPARNASTAPERRCSPVSSTPTLTCMERRPLTR